MKKIKQKIYNLLRWSEKYFKTDMVYLAKGGFWLNLGQLISAASSFLLSIAFANMLPKETYGTYKYILSIAGILTISTLPGIDLSLIQAVARGYEGSLIPALKSKICWGSLGGVASIGLALYFLLNNNIILSTSFFIISIFIPLINSFNIYVALLNGKQLFKYSARFQSLSQVIATLILIITLLFTKNLFFIIFAYFLSWTITRFVFFQITLRIHQPNKKKDPQTIPYGKHLTLINILGKITSQLDTILLWHYLGATHLAIYSFAIAPVNQMRSFLKPITPLALSKLAKNTNKKLKLFNKILRILFINVIFILSYILIAPYLYKIFFPQYLNSVKYSQFYVLTLFFFPKKLISLNLTARLKKEKLYIASIANSFIYLLSLIILLPLYGINGAILSILIANMINSTFLIYLSKNY